MSWPIPQPGLVIRYSYLWHSESQTGREEGVKDRPCAVVLAFQDEENRTRVYALPITHSPPGFFRVVRERFLAADRKRKAAIVARTE